MAQASTGKALLGGTVEESRVKRVEKQQSRYRDRGGLFVPADTNPLLDVLLARGVNGESPTKQRSTAPSPSPPRKAPKSRPSAARGRKSKAQQGIDDVLPVPAPKKASAATKRAPKTQSTAARSGKGAGGRPSAVQDGAAAAGPSKLPPAVPRTARPSKSKAQSNVSVPEQVTAVDDAAAVSKPGRQKRAAKPADDHPGPRKTAGKGKNSAADEHDSLRRDGNARPVADNTGDTAPKKASKRIENDVSADRKGKGTAKTLASSSRTKADKPANTAHGDAHKAEAVERHPRSKRRADNKGDAPPATADEAVPRAGPSHPPRRERAKPYVPPASESDDGDDVPIVAILQSKAVPATKATQLPSHDARREAPDAPATKAPPPQKAAREKDPPVRTADKRAGPSKALKVPKPAQEEERDEGAPAKGRKKLAAPPSNVAAKAKAAGDSVDDAPADASKRAKRRAAVDDDADEVAPKRRKKDAAKPAASKKKADKAPETTHDDEPVDAEPAAKGKGRAKAAAKRKEREEPEPRAVEEDAPEVDVEESRPPKRRKAAVNEDADDGKAKRLKSSSSSLKENRKAAKDAKKPTSTAKAKVPKPKPRMSMFPVPDAIEDSEDELDFLR
ncbi:hypothetical protein PsYK624_090760 [Phanerochaete sordida]|uniref:Uncharacterized protein n=1 Tax=Phanerochaete sordida TaxID=48140 RepID=A0A9P3GBW5_9APHY|nr:hypothetical protein PsYK624_090760 [Phanerochaete sordida]